MLVASGIKNALKLDKNMKKRMMILVLSSVSIALSESALAQATAQQNLTLAVNTIYRITTSGNPAPLTITTGTAGSDNLTAVTDNSTTYSITQNYGNTVRISANLDTPLPAGYNLEIALASTLGTSAGVVDLSNSTSGSAVNVVTSVQRGADAGQSITYKFSALASAGTMSSSAKIVTFTLTN
jgi:hypothetical protein